MIEKVIINEKDFYCIYPNFQMTDQDETIIIYNPLAKDFFSSFWMTWCRIKEQEQKKVS